MTDANEHAKYIQQVAQDYVSMLPVSARTTTYKEIMQSVNFLVVSINELSAKKSHKVKKVTNGN